MSFILAERLSCRSFSPLFFSPCSLAFKKPTRERVAVGDAVYALTDFSRDGAEAEYTIALPSELAPKPHSLTHVQAAAVPLSALTAWQALFEHAKLSAGET